MNIKLLWDLFVSFMKIDVLCFGGAYAAIPVIQKQVVEINGWLTQAEFMDILAIDELTPGPIILNCATFIGDQMAGIPGGIVATFGCVVPTALITAVLLWIYSKFSNTGFLKDSLSGMKCVVAALLISASISFIKTCLLNSAGLDVIAFVIFAVSFVVLRKTKIDAMFVVLAAGVVGLILYTII